MSGLFDKVKQAAESLTDEVKERVGGGSEQAEQNKAVARRFFEEVWNQGNLAALDEIMTPESVGHVSGSPDIVGPEANRQFITMYRTAFPDLQFTIEDEIAEGERVVTRWRSQGTHQGDLQGIAPTGRQAGSTGITISRVSGGRLVEAWTVWDQLGLLQQLGVIPAPGQASA